MRCTRPVVLLAFAYVTGCGSDDIPTTPGSGGSGGTSSSSSGAVSASSGGGSMQLPDVFTVTGIVTDGTNPVEGAIVMQGGGTPALVTGPDGTFTLELTQAIAGTPTVVAAKLGYRTRGVEFLSLPIEPVELALRFVSTPDNALGYTYDDPGKGNPIDDNSTAFCGHCHTTLTAQFQTSAHARATKDPMVQAIYAGVSQTLMSQSTCLQAGGSWKSGLVPGTSSDTVMKCYLGGGVLPDLNPLCGDAAQPSCDDPVLPAAQKPTTFGGCADCHAAALDGPSGGRNLLDATGLSFENGNHCDACHKVRDIDLSQPPGVAGALVLQRPIDKFSSDPGAKLIPVMFGPYPDVPNEFMGGSYQPKFSTSEFCAGCHQQKQAALLPGSTLDPTRWPDGLPTHDTYSEWFDSSYNVPATQCHFCHMPNVFGLKSTVDVTNEDNAGITFGFLRNANTIRSHIFRGPLEGSPRLIDAAVTLFLNATVLNGELTATLVLHNGAAGHAIPTGEPMRSLVLLVDAQACGTPMTPSSGMTINDVGGALAEGRIGLDADLVGTTLTWPAGASAATAGDVVRMVRPTGTYDDYLGIGFFADPTLTPQEKGLEINSPVGTASVVTANAGVITLDTPITAQPSDVVYLGQPQSLPADGQLSTAVAGAAGYTFAKVLVDPSGSRHVHHYRASDIVSDNRIAPQADAVTTHGFSIPPSCSMATVTATLLYRPVPVAIARQRGLDAHDYVVASTSQQVQLN